MLYYTPMNSYALAPGHTHFPKEASRQRRFVRLLEAQLAAQAWLAALWLGGSAARGEADRWSSVEIHCLVATRADLPHTYTRLTALLDELFPLGWTSFGVESTIDSVSIDGFTHSRLPAAADDGAVYFRLMWTGPDEMGLHRLRHGPLRLIWQRQADPAGLSELALTGPKYEPGHPASVQAGLIGFWQLLTRLPALINRGEHLAASALLSDLRLLLVDLVAALNGVSRPPLPTRINDFLGPAQQEAFEKSLHQPGLSSESWIGQAVALIVLYRWYAPQLAEMYNTAYPTHLEESVLALLSAEVPGWPALITTR